MRVLHSNHYRLSEEKACASLWIVRYNYLRSNILLDLLSDQTMSPSPRPDLWSFSVSFMFMVMRIHATPFLAISRFVSICSNMTHRPVISGLEDRGTGIETRGNRLVFYTKASRPIAVPILRACSMHWVNRQDDVNPIEHIGLYMERCRLMIRRYTTFSLACHSFSGSDASLA